MNMLQLGLAVVLASGLASIIVFITGVSNFYGVSRVSYEELSAIISLRSSVRKCVNANGLGLQAVGGGDVCQISIKFPSDTISKWKDPKTGELEGLSFDFNLCEAVSTWEQVRNSTTILTKEYIDALPNGWEEYAWQRINKGVLLNHCENKTLCMEKLSLVLPVKPPILPRQFARCAVVGNSGDLLKTKFGDEIDGYDAVIRENGAPIQNYTKFVGRKSTFRLLNRGSAKALDKVVELDEQKKEVLIIKTTIHDIMSKMIKEIPIHNPVYLMLGTSFGSAAKGTGLKALEFALSICDSVDMYGFTVDPGYKEWTRYFSESRQGHTPLYGRAYYQLMECLGLVRIHSPMRADFNRVVEWLPSPGTTAAARIASEKLLRRVGAGTGEPWGRCSIIKKRDKGKKTAYLSEFRDAVLKHQQYVKGAAMYALERSPGHAEGLKYYDLVEGKGTIAERGALVKVHFDCVYRGITAVSSRESKLLAGNRIIAQPYEFKVGSPPGRERKHEFIDNGNGLYSAQAAPKPPPAMYTVAGGMRVGGKRTVIVPPGLGYGEKGMNEIPPGATFELNIELLEVMQST